MPNVVGEQSTSSLGANPHLVLSTGYISGGIEDVCSLIILSWVCILDSLTRLKLTELSIAPR